jgi:toxin YhaV
MVEEVERLRGRLTADAYRGHPTVKLFAAVVHLLRDIVPADPNAPRFRLGGDLRTFRRAKKLGLPPRCRLFWVFSELHRTIVFLHLNDENTLRKDGANTDPYEIFRRKVARGEIGSDFEANLRAWRAANPDAEPRESPGRH